MLADTRMGLVDTAGALSLAVTGGLVPAIRKRAPAARGAIDIALVLAPSLPQQLLLQLFRCCWDASEAMCRQRRVSVWL